MQRLTNFYFIIKAKIQVKNDKNYNEKDCPDWEDLKVGVPQRYISLCC